MDDGRGTTGTVRVPALLGRKKTKKRDRKGPEKEARKKKGYRFVYHKVIEGEKKSATSSLLQGRKGSVDDTKKKFSTGREPWGTTFSMQRGIAIFHASLA